MSLRRGGWTRAGVSWIVALCILATVRTADASIGNGNKPQVNYTSDRHNIYATFTASSWKSWESVCVVLTDTVFSQQKQTVCADSSGGMIRVTNLLSFTDYSVYAYGKNSQRQGPNTATVTVQTLGSAPSSFPKNINLLFYNDTTVSLAWDSIPSGSWGGLKLGYHVEYNVQGKRVSSMLHSNHTSVIISNLEADTQYEFFVAAVSSGGTGEKGVFIVRTKLTPTTVTPVATTNAVTTMAPTTTATTVPITTATPCVDSSCHAEAKCRDESLTDGMASKVCVCNVGYSGDGLNCSDIDECESKTANCSADAVCTNANGTFLCSCHPGYTGDGYTCADIDECTTSANSCSDYAVCRNTVPSFQCSCKKGFSGDGKTCTDIDECSTSQHNCSTNGLCTNTIPLFQCSCLSGYSGDGVTCSDIDECGAGIHNCSSNASCKNGPGAFQCACNAGFSGDGFTCSDINECSDGSHDCHANAQCTNTIPLYSCKCNTGHQGSGTSCSDIDECGAGTHNCSSNASCKNGPGAFQCACNAGFSGDGFTCSDVNECSDGSHGCHANAQCTNTVPSYSCKCNTGYQGSGTACSDVNECDASHTPRACRTDEICNNTDGSFQCHCHPGYRKDTQSICRDINECLSPSLYTCGANQQCSNRPGSYTCPCMKGYSPNEDGSACADINECNGIPKVCARHQDCTNSIGSYTCNCSLGYAWNADHSTCNDVDECSLQLDLCVTHERCQNSQGSYACPCIAGYGRNGTECKDLNECDLSTHKCTALHHCINVPGGHRCDCIAGYSGNSTLCYDVNECASGTHTCSANAQCSNTRGTFHCSCLNGYTGDGHTCTDINECTAGNHTCHPLAECINTAGSYACVCSSGYTGNGRDCTDVDECFMATHNCSANARCADTNGGFDCTCLAGFRGDGYSCRDVNECSDGVHICSHTARCDNTEGTYSCSCLPGYSGNGVVCVDIDECRIATHYCHGNSQCQNGVGSYGCVCNKGYTGDGYDCDDINECVTNVSSCHRYANCTNLMGSYNCTCIAGFEGDGGSCAPLALGNRTTLGRDWISVGVGIGIAALAIAGMMFGYTAKDQSKTTKGAKVASTSNHSLLSSYSKQSLSRRQSDTVECTVSATMVPSASSETRTFSLYPTSQTGEVSATHMSSSTTLDSVDHSASSVYTQHLRSSDQVQSDDDERHLADSKQQEMCRRVSLKHGLLLRRSDAVLGDGLKAGQSQDSLDDPDVGPEVEPSMPLEQIADEECLEAETKQKELTRRMSLTHGLNPKWSDGLSITSDDPEDEPEQTPDSISSFKPDGLAEYMQKKQRTCSMPGKGKPGSWNLLTQEFQGGGRKPGSVVFPQLRRTSVPTASTHDRRMSVDPAMLYQDPLAKFQEPGRAPNTFTEANILKDASSPGSAAAGSVNYSCAVRKRSLNLHFHKEQQQRQQQQQQDTDRSTDSSSRRTSVILRSFNPMQATEEQDSNTAKREPKLSKFNLGTKAKPMKSNPLPPARGNTSDMDALLHQRQKRPSTQSGGDDRLIPEARMHCKDTVTKLLPLSPDEGTRPPVKDDDYRIPFDLQADISTFTVGHLKPAQDNRVGYGQESGHAPTTPTFTMYQDSRKESRSASLGASSRSDYDYRVPADALCRPTAAARVLAPGANSSAHPALYSTPKRFASQRKPQNMAARCMSQKVPVVDQPSSQRSQHHLQQQKQQNHKYKQWPPQQQQVQQQQQQQHHLQQPQQQQPQQQQQQAQKGYVDTQEALYGDMDENIYNDLTIAPLNVAHHQAISTPVDLSAMASSEGEDDYLCPSDLQKAHAATTYEGNQAYRVPCDLPILPKISPKLPPRELEHCDAAGGNQLRHSPQGCADEDLYRDPCDAVVEDTYREPCDVVDAQRADNGKSHPGVDSRAALQQKVSSSNKRIQGNPSTRTFSAPGGNFNIEFYGVMSALPGDDSDDCYKMPSDSTSPSTVSRNQPAAGGEEDIYSECCEAEFIMNPIASSEVTLRDTIKHENASILRSATWDKPGQGKISVHVKMLQARPPAGEPARLMQEAKVLNVVKHRNILQLYGVVNEPSKPLYLVLEATQQSLRSLLPTLRNDGKTTTQKLLSFCKDIAAGMEYIGRQDIIHKRLTTGKIFVTSDPQSCKIGGLSDSQADFNYEAQQSDVVFFAPELSSGGYASTKSDMWSFAFVLIELFTFGEQPKKDWQQKKTSIAGYQPKKPNNCPKELFALLKPAWCIDQKERPSFFTIRKFLISNQ